VFAGDEPLKLTFLTKCYGYTGTELQMILNTRNVECEFADPDHVTLMFSVNSSEEDLTRTEEALLSLPRRVAVEAAPPRVALPEKVMTPREVLMAEEECLSVEKCLGRVLASVTVGCPPAVPIAVSGERLGEAHLKAFRYYGIEEISVIKHI